MSSRWAQLGLEVSAEIGSSELLEICIKTTARSSLGQENRYQKQTQMTHRPHQERQIRRIGLAGLTQQDSMVRQDTQNQGERERERVVANSVGYLMPVASCQLANALCSPRCLASAYFITICFVPGTDLNKIKNKIQASWRTHMLQHGQPH